MIDDSSGLADEQRQVYYSGFWYTRGAFSETDSLTQTAVKVRVSQVLDELRLLALIYDKIYVPRSHFLTSFHNAHRNFISGVVQSPEFEWLKNNAILVSSASPGTDSVSDTIRIFERSQRLKWLRPVALSVDKKIISAIPVIRVDSKQEAAKSLIGYRSLATTFERARATKGLSDLIANSHYGDIEFFHERFINLLRNSTHISPNIKEEFWRATNEIYLSNIGSELGTVVIPYDKIIEPMFPRNLDNNNEAHLYNADTLRIILNTVVNSKKLSAWLNQNISQAFGFRENINSEEWHSWKLFQNAYFELLEKFDDILIAIRKTQNISLPDLNIVIPTEMTKISDRWGGDSVAAIIQAAGGIAQLGDPLAGVVTRTGAAGTSGLLRSLATRIILNYRYKEIMSFLKKSVLPRRLRSDDKNT